MIWRFIASFRRLVRDLREPPEVSRLWRSQQQATDNKQGWDRDVPWQSGKLDHETWKPGR